MTPSERLATLYPTPESITNARKGFTSWAAMSKALGFSKNSIFNHRKALGAKMSNRNAKKDAKSFCDRLTAPEINANIAKLMKGESKNIVTTYKITDLEAFEQDQRGYEHLELVGSEHGGNWGQVSCKVSAIKGRQKL